MDAVLHPASQTAHPRTVPVFAAFVAMLVLAALDQTILSTAMPVIARELHGAERLSWVFSAYLMASTVAIPLYGRLADVHGSKPLLGVAIALFLLGSLAGGFSQSMDQLIVARAIQGAGGGGLMTLTLLGVADLVPRPRASRLQGLLGACYGLATMFGPLLGGAMVEHLSWHWTFFVNVPVAAAALAVIVWGLPRLPVRPGQKVDVLGAALLAGTLLSLLLATRRDAGAGSWWLLALSAKLALGFVWQQRRSRHPIVPPSLFSRPAFTIATALSATAGVALFAAVVFLPIYLQTALGMAPLASAWHLLPLMAGITLAAVLSSRALRADGPVRGVAIGACALMALSFVALGAVFRLAPGSALALSACVLPLGLGIGQLLPLVTMLSQRTAPLQHIGAATATPIMVRALGGAVGVSALGALLAQQIAGRMGGPAHEAFASAFAAGVQPVFGIVAAVCALAVLAACALPARVPAPLMALQAA